VPNPIQQLSEAELFEQSVQDVRSLGWSDLPSPRFEPIEIPNPLEGEDEGLRLLIEFVKGRAPIDLRLSGEYVEGTPNPKGRLFLENLRAGRFAIQSHLDLHGLGILEARECFETFIRQSLQKGHGCVRIIHGRGHHSSDSALLKEHVQRWLGSRKMSRHVVAYTSARLHDGGGGALYVLLHHRK
jgi:DNA-nicking Smr family endonuclease